LRSLFMDKKECSRRGARLTVHNIANQAFDLYDALKDLNDHQRRMYQLKNSTDTIRGALGEIYTHELMKRLQGKATIACHHPGSYDMVGEASVHYRESGHSFQILRNKQTVCEIDGLMFYDGVPIIFETKTGASWVKQKSRETQCIEVAILYGARPLFVEVHLRDTAEFKKIGEDHYSATFPYWSQIDKISKDPIALRSIFSTDHDFARKLDAALK
jgi:hypothetical protein